MGFKITMKKVLPLLILLLIVLGACDDPKDQAPFGLVLLSDFDSGPQGWTPFFADLPSDAANAYRLRVDISRLPHETGINRNGLQITGQNLGDRLFFFMKKEVSNLSPNKMYSMKFRIDAATSHPAGTRQAERVAMNLPRPAVMITGGMGTEPGIQGVSPLTGLVQANFNAAVSAERGDRNTHVISLGPLVHEGTEEKFALVRMDNFQEPFRARANSDGKIWLIVGLSFSSRHEFEYYISSIRVLFNEL